jgi:ArsR family transcriptional regulator
MSECSHIDAFPGSPDVAASPDTCDVERVHPDHVEDVRAGQAREEEVTALAGLFGILASETRLRIVEALANRELCVCDLAEVAGVSASAVSHHLRHLRELRLVRFRREGRMAYYTLEDDHVTTLFHTALEHVRE